MSIAITLLELYYLLPRMWKDNQSLIEEIEERSVMRSHDVIGDAVEWDGRPSHIDSQGVSA